VNEAATPNYQRVRISALQALAAGGDLEAIKELGRRGVEVGAAVDVRTLDYGALRALVQAWRDGAMPDERERNRTLAERAQAELEARYRTDVKLHQASDPMPTPPPPPPWLAPRLARTAPWERPTGSKLYPSEKHIDRERLAQIAREQYAAGVPQKGR